MAKKKSKVGRKTIMTEAMVNKLEQAFVYGMTDLEACLYAGISKQTLYNYQDKFPEFVDRKELLKNSVALKAKANIAKSIDEGDKADTRWWLERKRKDEFSLKHEHELSGDLTLNVITGIDGSPNSEVEKIPTDENN